ncbi:hypothetical protein [Microlunatus flavus]|uniref:SAF domain-containing protein n=1 Tax=Microlunatus flavus TaxID=1036181 RepID=A0A1H9B2Z5_9ACTN|nr:hypothetical protein [Microlunatus flavus]SEP83406.1 hypothetical protein SAMN05421756_101825 [Microlunatus flavus]
MTVQVDPGRNGSAPGRRRAVRAGVEDGPTTPAPPRLPGRRNPRWIALGVVAICLGGLLSYAVYARVSTETRVLALASTVYRGEVLEAADLTTVVLHGQPPGPTVAAVDQASVVGKRAVFDLPAGALVAPASLADTALPATGRSVVGLRLATGRAPASLLEPSAPVRVVALPAPAGGTGARDSLVGKTYAGRVVGSTPGADGTSTVVDLEVDAGQAATIASLAAQDRIALVRDAGS